MRTVFTPPSHSPGHVYSVPPAPSISPAFPLTSLAMCHTVTCPLLLALEARAPQVGWFWAPFRSWAGSFTPTPVQRSFPREILPNPPPPTHTHTKVGSSTSFFAWSLCTPNSPALSTNHELCLVPGRLGQALSHSAPCPMPAPSRRSINVCEGMNGCLTGHLECPQRALIPPPPSSLPHFSNQRSPELVPK